MPLPYSTRALVLDNTDWYSTLESLATNTTSWVLTAISRATLVLSRALIMRTGTFWLADGGLHRKAAWAFQISHVGPFNGPNGTSERQRLLSLSPLVVKLLLMLKVHHVGLHGNAPAGSESIIAATHTVQADMLAQKRTVRSETGFVCSGCDPHLKNRSRLLASGSRDL